MKLGALNLGGLEQRVAAEPPARPGLMPLGIAIVLMAALAMPARALTLFGLVDTGELYASGDGGVSWSIRSTLPVRDAVALAAGATSTELFLASRTGSFFRSMDAGLNWTAVAAIPAADLVALVSSPGRLLLVTRSGSVYRSLDGGTNWSGVGTITASDLVSAARSGSQDFALTASGSVYRSLDAGASWSAVSMLTTSNAIEIAALAGKLYVLTATGDVARSDDAGLSWSFISTLSQVGMTTLLATASELIVSTEGGECAASASGATWAWRGVIGQLTVTALASDIPVTTGVAADGRGALVFLAPWPNPAVDGAQLALELEHAAMVTVEAFDAAGRRVGRPIAGELLPPGRTIRVWRPSELPSGSYYLRAKVGAAVRMRRLVWHGAR